ncbi:MAG: hypothetical protein C0392_01955 [Syntrophus sp. (in: bacteria)]|nr:hypothetical protein [Syntrophus sp. (in: bacteria)]
MTFFVVQNNSDGEIRIRYSLCCPGTKYWYIVPKIIKTSQIEDRVINWNSISEAEHTYDKEKGIVEIIVPANHTVLVNHELNYTGYNKDRSSHAKMLELTIISPKGQTIYAGNELGKVFKEQSKHLYILKYE